MVHSKTEALHEMGMDSLKEMLEEVNKIKEKSCSCRFIGEIRGKH